MVDLSAPPFNLDADAQGWVTSTLASMDTHAKVGQLFCLMTMGDPDGIQKDLSVIEPGGYMTRPLPTEAVRGIVGMLQSSASIPLLIAANLEKGADGLVTEGTCFGSQLQVAATDDAANAYRMGVAAGREARAAGGTWAFGPICDIQSNFRNPITNTRCFGSDPDRVARMSEAFVSGVQAQGLAASPKHFPGDGVDDRDQHLITSINSLPAQEWDATFGAVYRTVIDAGAKTVMVGHIAQPAKTRQHNPGIADADILPASLSPEMIGGVLRGELGFNGLVVTDASLMAGFMIPMPRQQAVPAAIAAGCDMFLFSTDLAQDVQYLNEGLERGIVSAERLDEAVTRVLALKASLGLHKASAAELAGTPLGEDVLAEHRGWAAESATTAVTVVKNLDGLLPLDATRHRRILVYSLVDEGTKLMSAFMGGAGSQPPVEQFADHLRAEGFKVEVFVRPEAATIETLFGGLDAVDRDRLLADFDAVVYLAQIGPASNAPVVRLNWSPLTANDSPKYINEIPTIFISLGSPFHLQDVPRIRTFINAYGETDATVKAVVDKMVGHGEFTGVSPVDPFCGYWDTHL